MSKVSEMRGKYSLEDLLKIREDDGKEFSYQCDNYASRVRLERIAGRSGIMPIHEKCSFDSFEVKSHEQKHALDFSRWFATNFDTHKGQNFIFSGDTGTGKNHLAAAICNHLMPKGRSCLVITITELMIKMRSCYGSQATMSEEAFIKGLVNIDFLVIDEIGLQRDNMSEKLLVNQLIDTRLGNLKQTGLLTNLGKEDLRELLGKRVMDRLKENNGQWVPFDWESYRR